MLAGLRAERSGFQARPAPAREGQREERRARGCAGGMKRYAPVRVRAFTMSDYDSASALWSKAEGIELCEGDSREELVRYLARNPGLSQIAEADSAIVGAALCGHDGRRGWIYHLVVEESYRARGVGKLLVDECLRRLHAAGIPRAIILVAADNQAGRK